MPLCRIVGFRVWPVSRVLWEASYALSLPGHTVIALLLPSLGFRCSLFLILHSSALQGVHGLLQNFCALLGVPSAKGLHCPSWPQLHMQTTFRNFSASRLAPKFLIACLNGPAFTSECSLGASSTW